MQNILIKAEASEDFYLVRIMAEDPRSDCAFEMLDARTFRLLENATISWQLSGWCDIKCGDELRTENGVGMLFAKEGMQVSFSPASMPEVEATPSEIAAERKSKSVNAMTCDADLELCGPLQQVIDQLIAIRERIPAEHRDSSSCDIRSVSDYDSHNVEVYITYERPETDEEVLARLKRRKLEESQRRASDLKQLARLQAKYGV